MNLEEHINKAMESIEIPAVQKLVAHLSPAELEIFKTGIGAGITYYVDARLQQLKQVAHAL